MSDDAEPKFFVGIGRAQWARILFGWGKSTIETSIWVTPRWCALGRTLESVEAEGMTDFGAVLPETQPSDLAGILFTSGSTGSPKGVMYTHQMFSAQVELLRDVYQIQPGERDLPTFPLFGLFDPALGMTTVVPDMDPTRPARANPRKLAAAIEQFKITNLFGSPALLNTLTRFTDDNELRFPTLTRILSAGAPVGAAVLKKTKAMLGQGGGVHTPYGATECLPIATISGEERLSESIAQRVASGRGVCIGRPLPQNDVRIVEVNDRPIQELVNLPTVSTGTVGEIIVRGPTTSQGYFGRPEADRLSKVRTSEDVPYFHRMGDLGYFDEDGYLWFCGRKAHRIERDGGFVCAVPVEQVVNEQEKVYRSALVDGGGGRLVVVLELHPKQRLDMDDENEIRRRVAVSGFPFPIDTFLVRRHLPVDIRHNAKIDREALSRWAQERLK